MNVPETKDLVPEAIGDLKVRMDDEGRIVCVTGHPPNMVLVGWCDAEYAKKEEWKHSFNNGGPPAYFVPYDRLESMESL